MELITMTILSIQNFFLFSEETKDLELTFITKCISAVEKRG